jgi:photosystem II stability/assembly factor-like uncharacterized protein
MMKQLVTISLSLIFVIILGTTVSFAQEFDELIVAPEVLFDGATPEDFYFRPGRILDENTIWFAGTRQGLGEGGIYIFRSVDGGATFTYNETPIPCAASSGAAQVDAFDANIALVSTADGDIYRTTDGGANWTEVYSYEEGDPWFNGLRVLNENVAIANGDGATSGDMHFVRSTDKGATWTEIESIDYLDAIYGLITFGTGTMNIGETVWSIATDVNYDSSFIFLSTDAGVNWNSYKISGSDITNYPRSVAFNDADKGMISDKSGNLIKSTDGGVTWMAASNPDVESTFANSVVAIPNTDLIVDMDDVGVFYTTDLGDTWDEISTPEETASDYIVSGMFFNTKMGYVFTDNGLVLRFEDQVTAISDPDFTNVPNQYRLSQNYPNPFNPETKISFSIPKAGDVTIKIYDIQGREVTTLVNASMNAGTHEVVWNGTNASGFRVASGLYVYTMKSADQVLSKKMVLMK